MARNNDRYYADELDENVDHYSHDVEEIELPAGVTFNGKETFEATL